MKKRSMTMVAVVLIAGSISFGLFSHRGRNALRVQAVPPVATTATAELRTIAFSITIIGEISPAEQVSSAWNCPGAAEAAPFHHGAGESS
jgi:hypothetical protein